MAKKIICIILLLFLTNQTFAQNPFEKGATSQSETQRRMVVNDSLFGGSLVKIVKWQRSIRTSIAGFVKEIKAEGVGTAFFILLGFSFLYGFVHALGPGHGKVITVSYFYQKRGAYPAGCFLDTQ